MPPDPLIRTAFIAAPPGTASGSKRQRLVMSTPGGRVPSPTELLARRRDQLRARCAPGWTDETPQP